MSDTPETKPLVAKIRVAKLSGKGGTPYRYTSTETLLVWRKEVRSELATAKRMLATAKKPATRAQRQLIVWKLVGEAACISRILRDRWQDPEDVHWMAYRPLAK